MKNLLRVISGDFDFWERKPRNLLRGGERDFTRRLGRGVVRVSLCGSLGYRW